MTIEKIITEVPYISYTLMYADMSPADWKVGDEIKEGGSVKQVYAIIDKDDMMGFLCSCIEGRRWFKVVAEVGSKWKH